MANPELLSGFDTNNTNTTTISAGKISDGYANGAILPSNEVNEMLKQLFEAANKTKLDGSWDWEAGLTYRNGALVWYNDTLWKSIAAANIGNVPVTGAFWKQPGIEDAVSLTGDQAIDGIKTFNASPIVPTPIAGTQAANKDYVDSLAPNIFVANDARVKTALNASGSAPIYGARAWVNFNGTGVVAIRASGNVSSITDNGVGNYTVNFITPMPDVNYVSCGNYNGLGASSAYSLNEFGTKTTSQLEIAITASSGAEVDSTYASCIIFR